MIYYSLLTNIRIKVQIILLKTSTWATEMLSAVLKASQCLDSLTAWDYREVPIIIVYQMISDVL